MGNILAHGFYPPPSGTFAGDLHFDDFETWTRNDPPTGIDLDTVALHEGGHTLGLDHSADPNAVMYAFYGGAHRELYDDDIAGIRERYGVRTRTIWSDFDATVDGQVDFASKAYFFKGAEYLRYDFDNDLPDPGFPAPIAGNWNGLPDSFTSDLDTTISGQGDLAEKLFFFKGSQYVRYDWREQRVDEGPLPIAGNWGGFPDAFTSGIDAAVSGNGDFVGFAFFFRGAEYIRYDWLRDSVGSDYPAPIAGYWPGLPEGFVTDIQAALNGRGPFDGKLYLFKGMQYLRFDWAMDNADTGYPLPIELYWM